MAIYPQMLNPNPRLILEVPFRRALLQTIDRAEMVESIQHGLVPVAHTIVNPVDPEFAAIERQVVRYEYDPRAAATTIESLGFARDRDGGFRDAAGQRLSVEIRSTAGDANEKSMFAVTSYWQRAGIAAEPVVIPRARANDREWRHSRPGFELQRQPNALADLDRYHSSQAPLPENNFTGTSKHRYMNPEMDGLIDRYFSTIPRAERVEVVGQIVHHMSAQLVPLPLFYDANPVLISDRVKNVTARKGGSTEVWNVEAWDLSIDTDRRN
jgi:peptide/nickel transport system substrate-binding protein